jgi:hypothetical protein
VANKREYLDRLRVAVQHLHKCGAVWRESVPVHEVFRGKTVWRGDVEVFDLTAHPKAQRCYAWSHLDGQEDECTRFVAVLEIPPVVGPQEAVKAAIVAEIKQRKRHKNAI